MTGFIDPVLAPTARIKPGAKISKPPSRRLRNRPHRDRTDNPARLMEWHAMHPAERAAAWAALVDWVVWLHDRYELSKEYKLPHCWPRHPGIIEELWALKAWRTDIYQTTPSDPAEPPDSTGVGQAARYWHAELRQTLTAIHQQYATGCLAGHKPAALLADTAPEQAEAWKNADPLTGIDPTRIPAPERTGQSIAAQTITDALLRGTATPLTHLTGEYVRYRGTWWTRTDTTWAAATAQRARALDTLSSQPNRLSSTNE